MVKSYCRRESTVELWIFRCGLRPLDSPVNRTDDARLCHLTNTPRRHSRTRSSGRLKSVEVIATYPAIYSILLRVPAQIRPTADKSLLRWWCNTGLQTSAPRPRLTYSSSRGTRTASSTLRRTAQREDILHLEAGEVAKSRRRYFNTDRLRESLGIQAAHARTVHPRLRRDAGFAIPASCAARASGAANHELTFAMDQSTGG